MGRARAATFSGDECSGVVESIETPAENDLCSRRRQESLIKNFLTTDCCNGVRAGLAGELRENRRPQSHLQRRVGLGQDIRNEAFGHRSNDGSGALSRQVQSPHYWRNCCLMGDPFSTSIRTLRLCWAPGPGPGISFRGYSCELNWHIGSHKILQYNQAHISVLFRFIILVPG